MLKTASSTQDEIPTLDDDEETTTENAIAHTYAASTRSTLEFLDEHLINMDLIVLLSCKFVGKSNTRTTVL
ncbi:hypothetical protein Pst134EA_023103 [Puccinia striiformis f. sp. tritici]|uniref:hypothetical protein n=1 Tax=Puccinia striiformis f. sp. tritici TaxID=168172 RepID=UPI002007CED1|nr:hypothetical protein Pst134EA_023103 [Puccinia striiformis f. sp. tritici]KAH9455644.1 hypothetical protein Pst134EA_023103 [Puccinia striiformis f. sp. tritici]